MSIYYHYVYRITNITENIHYYGKRSSKVRPEEDLGVKYFSSSRLKEFINEQIENPTNYKYKIIRQFTSSSNALRFEAKLHKKFDVGKNEKFYNMVSASELTKFDPTTMISVIDKNGMKKYVKRTDPRIKSGEVKTFNKGMVIVKDKEGNIFQTSVDDERYTSGIFKHVNKGRKGNDNQKKAVSIASKNTVCVVDMEGNIMRLSKYDPEIGKTLRLHSTTDILYELPDGTKKWLPRYTNILVSKILYSNSCLIKTKYDYYTPWGLFESAGEAYKHMPNTYNLSFQNVKIYCKSSETVIDKYRNYSKISNHFGKDIIGMTFKQIGFYRKKKFMIPL